MADYVDFQGDVNPGEVHAAADNVSAHTALRCGEKDIGDNDVKRPTELGFRVKIDASSYLSEEMLSFLPTSLLTASDHKKHLFNLKACQKLYYTAILDERISLQMKFVSVLCGTGDGSEEQHVLYMKVAKAILRNQLRPATDGHV